MSISITENYSITNHSASLAQREKVTHVSAVQATATFTFTSKPNEGSHITIIDAAGTSKNFEIDDNGNGTSGGVAVQGITAAGGGAMGTAIALKNTINAQVGFGITATTPSSGKILLTQNTAGTAGNKVLSVDDSAHWNSTTSVNVPASFTGGFDAGSASLYHDPGVGPFRVGLRGPVNIRLQPIAGHYQTFIGEQKL